MKTEENCPNHGNTCVCEHETCYICCDLCKQARDIADRYTIDQIKEMLPKEKIYEMASLQQIAIKNNFNFELFYDDIKQFANMDNRDDTNPKDIAYVWIYNIHVNDNIELYYKGETN